MQYKNSQSVVLSVNNIGKKFDQHLIFTGVSFTLSHGEKIGLVGQNGSGKSTLLKILNSIVLKDDGSFVYSKNIKVAYFPQVHMEANLSGGEIAKKVLEEIKKSNADIYLMDEPTNNLDPDGLQMVSRFIKQSDAAFIIISHDRAFLDSLVSKIIEIDVYAHTSRIYDGNYSAYAEERSLRVERQWKEYSDKVEKVGKLNSSIDQRLNWVDRIVSIRKGIKDLPIHEKNKPHAAVLRDKEGKAGGRAKIMKERLERYKEDVSEIVKPAQPQPLIIRFEHERGGTKVFDLRDVEKQMGNTRIGPINFHIRYGDRLHIKGPNGSGKTTLLKMLIGEITPDLGVIERGENVKIGYVSQQRWVSQSTKSVIEEFKDVTKLDETDSRKILNRFKISSDDVKKEVSSLSPGEYSRLVIAELVAISPNCIVLDEPSNHLDFEVLEELERALKEFKGTLILISHDQYFVERVGITSEINMIN